MSAPVAFGWWQVLRLALVQACLGSVVVITTSTLNRIMVVELMLPALLPGLLVGLHYAVQMVRPRMGFGADQGRRCTRGWWAAWRCCRQAAVWPLTPRCAWASSGSWAWPWRRWRLP